jgi:hypothetical protein
MSSIHSGFAPRWLKCIGCVLAMAPFALLVALGTDRAAPAVVVLSYSLTAHLSIVGLRCLVSGRAPRSGFAITMDAVGRLSARFTHERK